MFSHKLTEHEARHLFSAIGFLFNVLLFTVAAILAAKNHPVFYGFLILLGGLSGAACLYEVREFILHRLFINH